MDHALTSPDTLVFCSLYLTLFKHPRSLVVLSVYQTRVYVHRILKFRRLHLWISQPGAIA